MIGERCGRSGGALGGSWRTNKRPELPCRAAGLPMGRERCLATAIARGEAPGGQGFDFVDRCMRTVPLVRLGRARTDLRRSAVCIRVCTSCHSVHQPSLPSFPQQS